MLLFPGYIVLFGITCPLHLFHFIGLRFNDRNIKIDIRVFLFITVDKLFIASFAAYSNIHFKTIIL